MRTKLQALILSFVLIQLVVSLCAAGTPLSEASQSKILVEVVSGAVNRIESLAEEWSVESDGFKTSVTHSERLTLDAEILVILDALRLQQEDLDEIKTRLTPVLHTLEEAGERAKLAWVDDQGWSWLSPQSIPSQQQEYPDRQTNSLGAALFLDRLREIFEAARSADTPLQISVFSRDFPLPEFEQDSVSSTQNRKSSLVRQCLNHIVADLTNHPSYLQIVDLSTNSGYLARLAQDVGGTVTKQFDEATLSLLKQDRTYLLTLETSFQTSENQLPIIPSQPVQIRVCNQRPEWELQATGLIWPLPPDLQPPTLSDLLEAEQLRTRLDSLQRDGSLMQALVVARRIVNLSPFDLLDRIRILQVLKSIGNPNPAEFERSLDDALRIFPDSRELCYQKGLVTEDRGRLEEATRWYEKALDSSLSQPDLYLRLAALYRKMEQWERSVQYFERVLGTELDSAEIRLDYARSLWGMGSSDKARAELEIARDMDPGNPAAVRVDMQFAMDSEDYSQALHLARDVLKSDPEEPTANLTAGLALIRLDQHEEALSHLRRADLPDDFDLSYGLYECLMALGKMDEAVQHLEQAARLRPKKPEIWIRLTVLHERQGDRTAAREAIRRGAEENTENPQFYLAAAEWFEKHGDSTETLAHLLEALELASGQQRAQIAQRLVLLSLGKTGSPPGLEETIQLLDPELDKELIQMIQSRLNILKGDNATPEQQQGMVLPGGFEPLLKYAPFLRNRVQGEDVLDLFFGYLLETEPLEFANQRIAQMNARREEAVTFYREFLRFEKWFREVVGSSQMEQPITTEDSDLEAANKVLTYFGVKVRKPKQGRLTYTPDPDSLPKLEVVVEPRFERRRTVLKWFGISTNLIGEGSVLEVDLKDAKIPVLLGTDYWNQNIFKLDADREKELLLAWLRNPQAMKLYRALVRLPEPACHRFVSILTTDQLLEEITPGLLSMGNLLKFDEEGRIILPGGTSGMALWSQLVQAPPENEEAFIRNLFTREDGKVLYYLASLSAQNGSIIDFIMSSPARFRDFYELLEPPPRGNFLAGRPARNFLDMADLLTMLRTDGERVYFPASWDNFSHTSGQLEGYFVGDEKLIFSLFENEGQGSISETARKYAMLQALQFFASPLVSGAPERLLDLGALFELAADLGLDSDQVEILLRQMTSIEAGVSESDRRAVLALFQAPLVIIRILSDNRVIEREKIANLVSMLLLPDRDSWIAGDIAFDATSVLLEIARILETKYGSGKPLGLFLRAFADQHEPISFIWSGTAHRIDLTSRSIDRMRTSLEDHYVAPLDNLLEAFQHLSRSSDDPETIYPKIRDSVSPLLANEPPLDYLSDQYRQAIEHTDSDRLKSALDSFRRSLLAGDSESRKESLEILSGELAKYLAETLIALVYVRHIKENDFVVQTDEHFFRKHAFEESPFTLGSHGPQEMGGSWGQPILVKEEFLGSRIVGSLVGISRPLARLKAEQLPARSSTRFADSTFPVTQKLAVDLVDSQKLTDDAIQCAGTTMDLAEKLLAASIIDEKLQTFVFETIKKLCGSRRSRQIRQGLESGNLSAALRFLLPSEKFQLGKMFWTSQPDNSPSGSTDARLSWFFNDQPDCSEQLTQTFESPLHELGFPLTTMVGADILFLGHPSSIEESATYNSPHRLAERSCQLKLRMAELFWRMGLPSSLFKMVSNRVLDHILPRIGQVDREDWIAVTQQLQEVTEQDVESVLSELFDN